MRRQGWAAWAAARFFLRNEAGAITAIYALAVVPMLLSIGLAIDFSRLEHYRSRNQAALDAALISALSKDGENAKAETVQEFFSANGGLGNVASVQLSKSAMSASLSGGVAYALPTVLGRLIHIDAMDASVTSAATTPARLKELKIEPISAGGWWNKTMTLFATIKGDPAPQIIGTVTYTSAGACQNLPGTITDTFGGGWVPITNATSVWFQMDIDPASCGLPAGAQLTLKTDDPVTSDMLAVDGTPLPTNVVVDLVNVVPCGQQVQHGWEDGGNSDHGDFVYNVTGNCEYGGGGVAYLTK